MAEGDGRENAHPACRAEIRETHNALSRLMEAVRARAERDTEHLRHRVTQIEDALREYRPQHDEMRQWQAGHAARSDEGLRDIHEVKSRLKTLEDDMNGLKTAQAVLSAKVAIYAALGGCLGAALVSILAQWIGQK